MVSKLVFKGDKKTSKKKKIGRKISLSANSIQSKKPDFFVFINGESKPLSDINIGQLDNGWTNLYPTDLQLAKSSIIDSKSGKIPIVITYCHKNEEDDEDEGNNNNNENDNLCYLLREMKYTDDMDTNIKSKIEFSCEDVEYSDIKNTFNYTKDPIDIEKRINRVEPSSVSQVFILSNVTHLFKDSNKYLTNDSNEFNKNLYSIKTANGMYFLCDPEDHDLKLSRTLTENGLFILDFEISNGIPYVRLLNGDNKEMKTLIVTKNKNVKIIPDPEDLLKTMSRFTIRIKLESSLQTKLILENFEKLNNHDNDKSNSTALNDTVKNTVLLLSKAGFKINDRVIKEIHAAYNDGYLNQWIVEYKEKNVSDRMV